MVITIYYVFIGDFIHQNITTLFILVKNLHYADLIPIWYNLPLLSSVSSLEFTFSALHSKL